MREGEDLRLIGVGLPCHRVGGGNPARTMCWAPDAGTRTSSTRTSVIMLKSPPPWRHFTLSPVWSAAARPEAPGRT